MASDETFVILGAGLAGAKGAEALRDQGFEGRVVMIGDEADRPYDRPPLSKDYLQDKAERDKVFVHPESWYAERNVELRLETTATAIDRVAQLVTCDRGEPIRYDRLLLATGSAARHLPVPGADLEGVLTLRRLDDCERLKALLRADQRVVGIGAGWIGLEVAAAARAVGASVTVLEAGELPLQRVLGRELAEVFAALHRRHGVHMRFGVQVVEIEGDGSRVSGVRLADGTLLPADVVVVGIGAAPSSALAEAAGLDVDDGVTVDEHLCTSDPAVYAVGDVANAYHPLFERHIRVEHWANALNQPAVAAAGMLGNEAVYARVPYFFSDQYELGMEYSGFVEPEGYDEVVFRGDVDRLEFLAFWVKDGRVRAGMNVNIWDQTDAIQELVRTGRPIDTARLRDPDVPLGKASNRVSHRSSRGTEDVARPAAGQGREASRGAVVVAIATPLEEEFVTSIEEVDERLEMLFDPELLPPARFPCDHRGIDSFQRTEEQQRRWSNLLTGAEVLFGLPGDSPQGLAAAVRSNPHLRWVQATAGGAAQQVAAAQLSAEELDRVTITRASGVHDGPLAEFAMFGVLSFAKGLRRLLADQQARRWDHYAMAEVRGSTALIVGIGGIGLAVARLAKAFGMHTIGVNRRGRTDSPHIDEVRPPRFLGDLLPVAHAVIVTLPLTDETRGMIGPAAFGRMRTGSVLVNIGRGAVVDEEAMIDALRHGPLGGAVLDVAAEEPPPPESPLWTLPNVLISPHTAALSLHENERIVELFKENLRRYLAGDALIGRVRPSAPSA